MVYEFCGTGYSLLISVLYQMNKYILVAEADKFRIIGK